MAERFVNTDFEAEGQGWYGTGDVFYATYGIDGSMCAVIRGRSTDLIPIPGSLSANPTDAPAPPTNWFVDVTAGVQHQVSFQATQLYRWAGDLVIQYANETDEGWTELGRITSDDIEDWVFEPFSYSFTPLESRIYFRWAVDGGTTATYWLIDDASLQDVAVQERDMAVMLSELAIAGVMKELQASLSNELAGIELERSDTLNLVAPSRWRSWKAGRYDADITECEVYEYDQLSFPLFKRDISLWMTGARVPLRSSVRLVIAVNVASRESEKRSELMTKLRRHAAAVVRVLRNKPELGLTSGRLTVFPEFVRYDVKDVGGELLSTVGRVEVEVRCEMQEDAVGEGQAGGGVPPACNLE